MNAISIRNTCLLILLMGFTLSLDAQNLTIGTYNIRLDSQDDVRNGNGWTRRAPYLTQLVEFNDFDVIGMQEVLYHQLQYILKALPKYQYTGVGRDDGHQAGEFSPILFKKEKFDLLKEGHFWLSEQQDHPNKGWDAACVRICSWAYLKDKNTKKEFWFFNLHMDHVGIEARKNSAKLILSKIKEMCGSKPVILTGDFNVDQTNESYKLLAESGVLFDSYQVAATRYISNGTFNAFNPNIASNSRIDHIFVTKSFSVARYGVLTDSYRTPKTNDSDYNFTAAPQSFYAEDAVARMPSDHFPVKVIVDFQ